MSVSISEALRRRRLLLYTVCELQEILKTSKDRVLDMIARGDIVATNIGKPGGKRPTWRITEQSLADYLARYSTQPEPAKARRTSKYVPQVYTNVK